MRAKAQRCAMWRSGARNNDRRYGTAIVDDDREPKLPPLPYRSAIEHRRFTFSDTP
jgi:hypothetical protein